MWQNLPLMRARLSLWIVLTAVPVGALVLTLVARPPSPKRDAGFDQPGAAAWHDLLRRVPVDGADMPALYDRASASAARMQ